MEDITLREALVGDNGLDKDTSRNIKVVMKVISALPIMSLSQVSSPGAVVVEKTTPDVIEYNSSMSSAYIERILPVDVTNVLVGVTDTDRYTLIGKVATVANSIEGFIYRDAVHKDMILIPTLKDLGDTGKTENFFKNHEIHIEIYRIGCEGDMYKQFISKEMAFLPTSTNDDIPTPLDTIDTKVHMLQLPGWSRFSTWNNAATTFGDNYVESNHATPSEFVSLGNTDRLFGPGIKVPTFRFIRKSFGTYVIQYVGRQSLDDMLIPIPF